MNTRAIELLGGQEGFLMQHIGIKRGDIVDVLSPILSSSPEQGRNADVAMGRHTPLFD